MVKEITEKFGDEIKKYRTYKPEYGDFDTWDLERFDLQTEIENYFEENLKSKYRYYKCETGLNTDKKSLKSTFYCYIPYMASFECNDDFSIICRNGLMIQHWHDSTNIIEKYPFDCFLEIDIEDDGTDIYEPITKEEFLEKWNNTEYWDIERAEREEKETEMFSLGTLIKEANEDLDYEKMEEEARKIQNLIEEDVDRTLNGLEGIDFEKIFNNGDRK